MARIGKALTGFRGCYSICPNYGGYVVVDDSASMYVPDFCFYIYKTENSAKNAVRKFLDGTNKSEPKVIRRMTDDEFIHAFTFGD